MTNNMEVITGKAAKGWVPEDLNPNGFENLSDMLAHCCQQYDSKPAFTSMGCTISYAQLDAYSAAFATYLQTETNLMPGDRIAIQLPNLVQYPIAAFGALRVGLVVVNTNPLYSPTEMAHQFRDSGAKALLIYQCMAHNAEKVLADTKIETVLLTKLGDMHSPFKRNLINFVVKYVKKMQPPFSLPKAESFRDILKRYAGRRPEPVAVGSAETAVLQYTGGTTGVSKGAELSHANLLSNTFQGVSSLHAAGEDWVTTVISPLPLYHIYAFTMAQGVMCRGGHSILIPNPRDIPGFVQEMKKWQASTFLGLNTLFVALCRDPGFKEVDFSQLKATISGGMALTHAAAESWAQVTGCKPLEGYGLTETSPLVTVNPPQDNRLGTIGLPVPHTKVRIIGADGSDVEPGEAGELCVWGPQVMVGYWQREQDTRDSFTEDGYFLTGDIATMDPDGYFRIVDRAKDLIIVSGFNVYPNEIEDVASQHPDIIECAAIGVPDEISGETVKLFVVKSSNDLSEEEVRLWCREHLTGYKVPQQVTFVDELPKTNVGKVLRRALRS